MAYNEELHALKAEQEKKFAALITECGMFFAFSDQQFEENKTPLREGEKYLRLFGGAFMPKGNMEKWKAGSKAINDWFKTTLKENKLRRANIAYELANHEAYYTCDIDQTLEALGEEYTREEVQAVYNEEAHLHYQD